MQRTALGSHPLAQRMATFYLFSLLSKPKWTASLPCSLMHGLANRSTWAFPSRGWTIPSSRGPAMLRSCHDAMQPGGVPAILRRSGHHAVQNQDICATSCQPTFAATRTLSILLILVRHLRRQEHFGLFQLAITSIDGSGVSNLDQAGKSRLLFRPLLARHSAQVWSHR